MFSFLKNMQVLKTDVRYSEFWTLHLGFCHSLIFRMVQKGIGYKVYGIRDNERFHILDSPNVLRGMHRFRLKRRGKETACICNDL